MTPPSASLPRSTVEAYPAPAALACLVALTKRADFQRASRAKREATPGFILQARKRRDDEPPGIRVGYTCSKKVGNAVARNRAKRRLRELARHVLTEIGRPDVDYVLIGRREQTATRLFTQMTADLHDAVVRLNKSLG